MQPSVTQASTQAPTNAASRRPLTITLLAIYSLLLALITGIPQLYHPGGQRAPACSHGGNGPCLALLEHPC